MTKRECDTELAQNLSQIPAITQVPHNLAGHVTPPEEEEPPIDHYIPPYLRRFVFPHHGDFCQTRIFHPRLIVEIMAEGFLPIATKGVLLPKLHHERSVIFLPHQLHRSKSVLKKSNKFSFTINTAFREVVQGCQDQHDHCWLYPALVDAFHAIYKSTAMEATLGGGTTKSRVRIYSIEVWQDTNLAAGELGYTVGSVYTSLTGFSKVDSAGSVQMAALGKVLCEANFSMWDLGMDMDYKRKLGAILFPRSAFVRHIHAERGNYVALPNLGEAVNCKFVLERGLSALSAMTESSEPSGSSSPSRLKPQLTGEQGKHKKQKSTTKAKVDATSDRCAINCNIQERCLKK